MLTADELPIVIIPIAAVILLFAGCGVVDYCYTRKWRNTTSLAAFKSSKKSEPVIGYKRANISRVGYGIDLKGHTWLTRLSFTGIVGYEYQINDHAKNGTGFHMYSSLSDAINHPQNAEVILEVLGYGKVIESEKGYRTSDQRVLQVLIGECRVCYRQASYLALRTDASFVSVCPEHKHLCPPNRRVSLEELAEQNLPEGVIFAPLTATAELSAFTPTVINSKAEKANA